MCGGGAYERLNICGHGESGKHQRPQYRFRRRIGNPRYHDHNVDHNVNNNIYVNHFHDIVHFYNKHNSGSHPNNVFNLNFNFNIQLHLHIKHLINIKHHIDIKHNINDSGDEGDYNNNYRRGCYCPKDGRITEGISGVV